jgi:hypothetical protein
MEKRQTIYGEMSVKTNLILATTSEISVSDIHEGSISYCRIGSRYSVM